MSGEHVHDFRLQSRWERDPRTGMFWQHVLSWRKRCECGALEPVNMDPAANMRAAVRALAKRYGLSTTWTAGPPAPSAHRGDR